jgi:hypothetical protein
MGVGLVLTGSPEACRHWGDSRVILGGVTRLKSP